VNGHESKSCDLVVLLSSCDLVVLLFV
jgi:hypothetical protein